MDTEKNLSIWSKVNKTNPKHIKEVRSGGRKLTAIDAQYQVQEATRIFGSMGSGWGTKDDQYHIMQFNPNNHEENVLVYTAKLWYKWDGEYGEMSIASEIPMYTKSKTHGTYPNTDIHKKVSTDALTKGLSRLGFSADVFLGLYDDNKYVAELNKEFKEKDVIQNDSSFKKHEPKASKSESLISSIQSAGGILMKEHGMSADQIKSFMSKVSELSNWRKESDTNLAKINEVMQKVVLLNKASKLYDKFKETQTEEKFVNHVDKTIKEVLKLDKINTGFSDNPSLNNDVSLADVQKVVGVIEGFLD